MSGFVQRSQQETSSDQVYDYSVARPTSSQAYTAYPDPPFVQQYPSSQAPEVHAVSPTHHSHMPLLGHYAQARDIAYHGSTDVLSIPKARPPPRPATLLIDVTSKGPYYGKAGEKLRITLHCPTDFELHPARFCFLLGSVQALAYIAKLSESDRNGQIYYSLTTDIPNLDGLSQYRMPLILDVLGQNGETYNAQLGDFTYVSLAGFESFPLQQLGNVKKRKQETGPQPNFSYPMAKRAASQPQQPRYSSSNSAPSVQSSPPPIPQQYISTGNTTPLYALPTGYEKPLVSPRGQVFPIARTPRYDLDTTLAFDQKPRTPGEVAPYPPLNTSFNPPRRILNTKRSMPQMTDLRSPSMPVPQLIRTSVLEQSQQSSVNRGFNPYAHYSTGKAKLALQGDLMAMTQDWTPEERTIQRRLVEFNRSQTGNVVSAHFKAVTLEERIPNSACVSCIYWQDRDEYFVTSVDTIALLEGLIAARFTVEEKNRIRRNLEGYKPMTVSKLREDTDAFFRLIMGFPNPKPRNIEKDVKVFPWSKLTEALNKIFDKYSASSASTASHIFYPTNPMDVSATAGYQLPPTLPSGGGMSPTRSPISPVNTHHLSSQILSPRHASQHIGGPYRPGVPSHHAGAYSLPISVTEPQDYATPALSLNQMTHAIAGAQSGSNLQGWTQQPHQSSTTPTGYEYQSLGMGTPGRSAAWDAASYLVSASAGAQQSSMYARTTLPTYYSAGSEDNEVAGAVGSSTTPIPVPSMMNRPPYSMHSQPTSTAG